MVTESRHPDTSNVLAAGALASFRAVKVWHVVAAVNRGVPHFEVSIIGAERDDTVGGVDTDNAVKDVGVRVCAATHVNRGNLRFVALEVTELAAIARAFVDDESVPRNRVGHVASVHRLRATRVCG